MTRAKSIYLTLLAILLSPMAANADVIINNTGIDSPSQVVTFSEFIFPTETLITDQYSSLGVTFSPGLCYNVQPDFFPTESLASFALYGSDCVGGNNSIFFDGPVDAAALALQSNPETTTFTALLNSVIVETFSAETVLSFLPDLTNASNFYGFTNILFDELQISNASGIYQIDNLQFSAASVPEPGTLGLLGIGLLGLGLARRGKD